MRLTFLGQPYTANATAIAPIASELTGRYRGHLVTFSHAHGAPQSNLTLTYRGTRYSR